VFSPQQRCCFAQLWLHAWAWLWRFSAHLVCSPSLSAQLTCPAVSCGGHGILGCCVCVHSCTFLAVRVLGRWLELGEGRLERRASGGGGVLDSVVKMSPAAVECLLSFPCFLKAGFLG
jgi:hypothetical protein